MRLIVIPRSQLWRKDRRSEVAHLWGNEFFMFDVVFVCEAPNGLHNREGVGMRIPFHATFPFGLVVELFCVCIESCCIEVNVTHQLGFACDLVTVRTDMCGVHLL